MLGVWEGRMSLLHWYIASECARVRSMLLTPQRIKERRPQLNAVSVSSCDLQHIPGRLRNVSVDVRRFDVCGLDALHQGAPDVALSLNADMSVFGRPLSSWAARKLTIHLLRHFNTPNCRPSNICSFVGTVPVV
jgi:hypothetical protein